ncbi:MucR family transcriptional regulator [Microvirga roseola]|uniref:MucR family transcriptional regulator n=1 Tax=Microvirga roseola TaxID=2883126 RepID=UPI001E59BFA4|nr:MucR family transcriptional regulator [Microvirga roseola]
MELSLTDQLPTPASSNFVELAAEIVSAYVQTNAVPSSELPALIGSVYGALAGLASPQRKAQEVKLTPAVSIKKSVQPDYLISLEDGKHYKTLKRHLTGLNLTPDGYRAKWGLPADYPMVAPSYAAHRSELAKTLGLGRKPAAQAETKLEAPKGRKRVSKKAA